VLNQRIGLLSETRNVFHDRWCWLDRFR
jgi:hypothetical protein